METEYNGEILFKMTTWSRWKWDIDFNCHVNVLDHVSIDFYLS